MGVLLDHDLLEAFVAASDRAASKAVLAEGFLTALKPFGFTEFAAMSLGPNLLDGPTGGVWMPYDNPHWYALYREERFQEIDPILAACRHRGVPFVWQDYLVDRRLSPAQRRLFAAARDFGHGWGLTVPIHGFGAAPGLVSVVADRPFDASSVHLVHLLARSLFAAAHRLARPDDMSPARGAADALSPRERECLRWSALGKSAWEIGTILNISELTVRDYLASARLKFGVRTTIQAVARAIGDKGIVF